MGPFGDVREDAVFSHGDAYGTHGSRRKADGEFTCHFEAELVPP